MTGHLLTVGDELLLGQIVNTNAAWLGEHLALAGVDVATSETVGDDIEVIGASIAKATAQGARVIVVTGGLGPTHDDVTVEAVARAFDLPLEERPDVLGWIRDRYESRGRVMPEIGRRMARLPEGFEALRNTVGSAPGLWGTRATSAGDQFIAVLPGVPGEMKALFESEVAVRLAEHRDGTVLSRTILTVGKGESDLSAQIEDLVSDLPPGLSIAYLPSLGSVRIRVTARGTDSARAQSRLDSVADAIRQRLGRLVFGEGKQVLEAVVLDMLAERGSTVAIAESCTGGRVSSRLTAIPGASRVVLGGVVAYSNSAKADILGVDPDVIEAEGAVSESVARQLAAGVRQRLGADIGVATTGVAGPTGGSPEKPVGTVWIAYDDGDMQHAVRLQLLSGRSANIELSSTAAIDLVRRQLMRRDQV
ncbi:MAG: competence/damage-inducible protein A [Bacteroidota bacterium]